MKKNSVAIATFNEQYNIGRCLSSVVDWVDEIIVVDGSSTDDTVKIAQKYNAKVIETDNPPIFHINKQKAINASSGDWILQLDADEIVTNALRDEIVKLINQRPQPKAGPPLAEKTKDQRPITGFYIPRKNFLLGKWLKKGGAYPDYVIRLFKKEKGRFPCKSVHEQIEIDGEIDYLKNDLLHYPYPTFSDYIKKADTYTSLTVQEFNYEKLKINISTSFIYMIVIPIKTFFDIYFRRLGFLDRFPGFVWALFSALHYPIAYIKYWEKLSTQRESKN